MMDKKAQALPAISPVFTPAPKGLLQRACACGGSPGVDGECEECRNKHLSLQRQATSAAAPPAVPPIVHEVLNSPGQPLETGTRAFMEPRFGHDFSQVRVHTDARAAESAHAVHALAYTVGRDVVFGTGQYQPGTSGGRRLLAHELTHVVQQRGGLGNLRVELPITSANHVSEREADSIARQITKEPEIRAGSSQPMIPDHASNQGVTTSSHLKTSLPSPIMQTAHVEPGIQRAVATAPEPVAPEQMSRFRDLIAQYQALLRSNTLSQAEITEVNQAISRAEDAIRQARSVAGAGHTSYAMAGVALAATATLTADDVTVVGVADDVAIPFTLIAAGVLGLVGLIKSSSARDIQISNQAAVDAVSDAISKIGQIVLAARVGEQVRGLTNQVVIHLARLLGTTVGGQPPDHQQDPNRDRPHWWREIKNFIQQILDKGLSPRQLLRELGKRFTAEQLAEIREALRRAAQLMGEDPPDFPPTATP